MELKEFYQIYIPALKKAFDQDDGINLPDPEKYIEDSSVSKEISMYIDKMKDNQFLDMVGYYLDSRTHNFPDVGDIDIDTCREKIIEEMKQLALEYKISLD